jgi:hypothetical protein
MDASRDKPGHEDQTIDFNGEAPACSEHWREKTQARASPIRRRTRRLALSDVLGCLDSKQMLSTARSPRHCKVSAGLAGTEHRKVSAGLAGTEHRKVDCESAGLAGTEYRKVACESAGLAGTEYRKVACESGLPGVALETVHELRPKPGGS